MARPAASPTPGDEAPRLTLSLLASGSALWLASVLRNPTALQMLPGIDGCLVAGVVGALLALLHGVPHRLVIFALATPVAIIQVSASARASASVRVTATATD